jgi:hypothetical protein
MWGGVGSRSNECGIKRRLKKVDKRKRGRKRASRRGKDGRGVRVNMGWEEGQRDSRRRGNEGGKDE